MENDFETKEGQGVNDDHPDSADFSITDVNHLWRELTINFSDPTVTFEQNELSTTKRSTSPVPYRCVVFTGDGIGNSSANEGSPDAPSSASPPVETEYQEYELGEVLGEGGMGVIYEAKQSALDRSVAIKMLKPNSQSSAHRQKFLSEAILTGSLEHPNIVALHDLALDRNDNLFYSMKKINGEPWSQSINEKTVDENLEIFFRICNAVAFAHSRHIIHRDIKPGNVMLGEFGEVLLMDWGLAVKLPEDRPLAPHEYPGLGGTPSYMSPELARGDFRRLGIGSDVYLLGAVLFQIVTGKPPHDGPTVVDVLKNAANNRIIESRKQGELLNIALKAMEFDPDHRFASATDLRSRIRRFQTHTQSMGLTRRAKKLAKRARRRNDYTLFANAIMTFDEALDVWSDNIKAQNGIALTRKYFAESAIENGDLDLAATILETDESGNDTIRAEQTSLSNKIDELQKDRIRQKKKDDRMRSDLKKWSHAFNVSPDVVAISRLRDGLIFEVNEAFLTTLGYSCRNDVIGQNSTSLRLWVDLSERESFIKKLETDGFCSQMETRIRKKNGEIVPVILSARTLGFDGERSVITHAHDISHRKEMERRLTESESRLRETQELAKMGTWEFDLATKKIKWSPETFRIIGLEQESGEPSIEEFMSTVHPEDAPKLQALIRKAQTEGVPYRTELRHRRPDGTFKHVLATGKPQFANEEVRLLFGSVMDISEYRQ